MSSAYNISIIPRPPICIAANLITSASAIQISQERIVWNEHKSLLAQLYCARFSGHVGVSFGLQKTVVEEEEDQCMHVVASRQCSRTAQNCSQSSTHVYSTYRRAEHARLSKSQRNIVEKMLTNVFRERESAAINSWQVWRTYWVINGRR